MVVRGHKDHTRADGQRVAIEQVVDVDEAVCVPVHSDETVALLLIEGLDRAHLVWQLPASLLHDLLHNLDRLLPLCRRGRLALCVL